MSFILCWQPGTEIPTGTPNLINLSATPSLDHFGIITYRSALVLFFPFSLPSYSASHVRPIYFVYSNQSPLYAHDRRTRVLDSPKHPHRRWTIKLPGPPAPDDPASFSELQASALSILHASLITCGVSSSPNMEPWRSHTCLKLPCQGRDQIFYRISAAFQRHFSA